MAKIMMSKLMENTLQKSTIHGKADIFMLHSHADVDVVMKELIKYFGESDEREAIRLYVDGKYVGFLPRINLYGFVGTTYKGVDTSGYAVLPGSPNFHCIELQCPVGGCQFKMFVMHLDEDDLPMCPVHPDQTMEIKK